MLMICHEFKIQPKQEKIPWGLPEGLLPAGWETLF